MARRRSGLKVHPDIAGGSTRRKASSKPTGIKLAAAVEIAALTRMSTPQLVALGSAGARAELKRRGRDPATGKKRR